MFRSNDFWLSYSWTCIFCSNVKLSGLFFDVLWYIDLIFGMWLYLDELQFKFEFRSGRMTFGWVMALELVFFVQILRCPDLFWHPLIYWLVFGMWLYLYDYSLSSNFPLNLYLLFKFEVVRTFLWCPLIYWLDIWYVAISRWVTV